MNTSAKKMRAIITGASSGIGQATAIALAKAGVDVAVVARSLSKLEAVVNAAREKGVESKAYAVDLAEIQRVKAQITAIVADFGPIDILVNNAGMGYTNSLQETSLEDWQEVLNLNLTSVFQTTLAVLPSMRERGKGTIINVASIAAHNFFPGWGAYSVSKSALIALSKTLAVEERANGIRVSIISPGAVNTPIWDSKTVQADFNRQAMLTPEVVADTIVQTILLPPSAAVEETILMPSAGAL